MREDVLHLVFNSWRDGLAILSTLITIGGFWLAIWQIRRAKSAAEAASESASQMLKESRDRFEGYSLTNLIQYATEIEHYASSKEWRLVTLRLKDLSLQAMQLSHADPGWKTIADELLVWAHVYLRIANGEIQASVDKRKKLAEFLLKLNKKLAERHGPFGQTIGGDAP